MRAISTAPTTMATAVATPSGGVWRARTHIERRCPAAVPLPDQSDLAAESRQRARDVVRRAVVDHDHLFWRMGLLERRRDRVGHRLCCLVGRNDHGEGD